MHFFSLWHLLAWTQKQLKTGIVAWGQREGIPKKLPISGQETGKGLKRLNEWRKSTLIALSLLPDRPTPAAAAAAREASTAPRVKTLVPDQRACHLEGREKPHCFPPHTTVPSLLGPRRMCVVEHTNSSPGCRTRESERGVVGEKRAKEEHLGGSVA